MVNCICKTSFFIGPIKIFIFRSLPSDRKLMVKMSRSNSKRSGTDTSNCGSIEENGKEMTQLTRNGERVVTSPPVAKAGGKETTSSSFR